ncbi:MAG: hypothetical protein ACXVY3_03695 [Gaiellaceae bacterium]
MSPHLEPLSLGTLKTAPSVCHECIWWQTSGRRATTKKRWMERAEDEWGAWGTIYYDDDGRVLGSLQYGPSFLFPRASELPAGPSSEDAALITCAYLVDDSSPWVMQSLFLSAMGDARDRGARALEAFAYRYGDGEGSSQRFILHRTVFPHDFLADFGFLPVRSAGRVELARLDLGGLQPVVEGKRSRVLRVVRAAFFPAPVPAPRP